jgi:diguanylate cyclase (GGDEF)-like protein
MMNDFFARSDLNIKKEINTSYCKHINELIIFRFRLVSAIGIVLHLAFYFIDQIAYPAQAFDFLNIRRIDCFIISMLIFISYLPKVKPYIIWLVDMAGIVMIFGIVVMVFISDGSSSRYYEGVNLIFLGLGVVNPFYIWHMIGVYLLSIGVLEYAMFVNHTPFNSLNFLFASYFMGSTALFVILMAKFYRDQHYKAFVRQEQLKTNEETLAALYNQADKLSKTDTLTEINNRRHFSDMLQKKMAACERAKTSFFLVIFDIDFFKQINDTYGHTFGDKVLVKVVEVVKNNTRTNDFIGRFGGDEFIICLDMPSRESIAQRLTKISFDVRNLGLTYEEKPVSLSLSIGAAKFKPGENVTEEKLMERADFELFHVKKTGRGQISIED